MCFAPLQTDRSALLIDVGMPYFYDEKCGLLAKLENTSFQFFFSKSASALLFV
jgi:hypothetical protein